MRQIHWRKNVTRCERIQKDIFLQGSVNRRTINLAIAESSQVLQWMHSRAMSADMEFHIKASGPGSLRCPGIISRLMLSKLETQEEPVFQCES